MRKAVLALAGLSLLAGGWTSTVEAQGKKKRASVTIVNKSDWRLDQLYLSATDEDEWGPDQLGKDVIDTGGAFTLTDITCDTYDVKLVDEDGDECVLQGVDLCGSSEKWTITSKDLLKCQAGS